MMCLINKKKEPISSSYYYYSLQLFFLLLSVILSVNTPMVTGMMESESESELEEPLPHPFQLVDSSHHETLQFVKRESSSFNQSRNDSSSSSSSFYYYSSIFSPNFPSEFATPFTKFYVINMSTLGINNLPPNPILNIYLCELFTEEKSFNLYDGGGEPRPMSQDVKQIPIILGEEEVAELQIFIENMQNQFRTKLHFHNLYGYNLTLEVISQEEEEEEEGVEAEVVGESNSCSLRNCSYAGRCKATPGERRLEFHCECLEGYSGPYCQYGPECDPRRNINFCKNGGTCRMFGYAGGKCDCLPGFGGSKCQLRKRSINFVTLNRDCGLSNGYSVEDRPCSLCNTFPEKPASWHRFLLILESSLYKSKTISSSTVNLTQGPLNISENYLAKVFEEHLLGREWVDGNRTIVEVFGRISEEDKINKSRIWNTTMTWTFPLGPTVTLRRADSISTFTEGILQPSIWMNKEKEKPLLEGQEFSLTCRSRRPSHGSLIQFRWFKDHVLIRKEYTTRNRHISQFPLEPGGPAGDEVWSFLMIDNVSPFDMGVFTCQVTDLMSNVQECADYSMLVVVPPQIEVMPMSVTMVKNETKILICSDSLEAIESKSHDNLEISWYKDGEPISRNSNNGLWSTEAIYPQGQLLRLRAVLASATFTCRAKNKGGVRDRHVRVEVLQPWASPKEYCPRSCEVVEGAGSSRLNWGLTALHSRALVLCPRNFSGYAQRRCGLGEKGMGKWESTDFSRCSHQELGHFNFTLRSMQNGYNVRSDGLSSLHSELNSYLEGRKGSGLENVGGSRGGGGGGQSLLYGEGDKFIRMLEDTFAYVKVLNRSAPRLVEADTILGLISVVDNFITFRNSCSHPAAVDHLVHHFFSFLKEFRVDSYSSPHIFIQRVSAPHSTSNESSPVVIEGTSTQLSFDCNAITTPNDHTNHHAIDVDPGADVEELEEEDMDYIERFITFTEISGLSQLNENVSILSAVVRVDLSPGLEESNACVKDDAVFQLLFQPLLPSSANGNITTTNTNNTSLHGNKTCGRLDGIKWTHDVCTLNSTMEGVICLCKVNLIRDTEAYAVLALEETPPLPPKVAEMIQLPPEWIAASGVIVCLVLCSRTLVVGLIRRVFQPHFLLVSSGLIITCLCLLHIILMSYSIEVGLTYMTLTLGMQAVRIWRMICVADMLEMHPWLEHVSPWIVLTAITFTQIGPLLTVFLVDSALFLPPNNDNSGGGGSFSVLDQHSAVFITFSALVALSVLSILALYYKTHIRFHRKAATTTTHSTSATNNFLHGDKQILNETFCQTLVHMVQILTLVLYINLRRHIFFHYIFAVSTSILGLAWRLPRKRRKKNNPSVIVTGGGGGGGGEDSRQPLPSHYTMNGGRTAAISSTTTQSHPTTLLPIISSHPFNNAFSKSNGICTNGGDGGSRRSTLLQYKLELKPLTLTRTRETEPPAYVPQQPIVRTIIPRATPEVDEEEEEEEDLDDPITFDTNVSSVSTITSNQGRNHTSHIPTSSTTCGGGGLGFLTPYLGVLPKRAECHLLMDDGYVLPSLQPPFTNKSMKFSDKN